MSDCIPPAGEPAASHGSAERSAGSLAHRSPPNEPCDQPAEPDAERSNLPTDGPPATPAAAAQPPLKDTLEPGERVANDNPSDQDLSAANPDDVDPTGQGDPHTAEVQRWRQLSERRRERGRKERPKRPWWVELPILIVIAFVLTFLIQTFVARVYYVPSGSMEQTLHGNTHGGDRILAFKLVYDFRAPKQGEVVVFKGPATWTPEATIPGPSTWFGKAAQALGSVVGIAPPNEKDYVKRVIAVGGQTVSCCDAEGRVQVDGVSLDEPYLFMDPGNPQYEQWRWVQGQTACAVDEENPTRYGSIRCFGPYTVPKDSVWVMGDHRTDSADSSYQCRGLVPAPNVQCQGPIPVDDVIGKAVAIVMPPSRWGGIASPDIMESAGQPSVGSAPEPRGPTMPAFAPFALTMLGVLGVRAGARRRR